MQEAVSPRRGGRPTRADSLALRSRLVAVAQQMFLQRGYEATRIEAVVQACAVSKRTFYDRFPDKASLFAAVVHEIVEALRPQDGTPLVAGQDVRAQLRWFGTLALRAALQPQALALHRLIMTEAQRFPDLAAVVRREGGGQEAAAILARILREGYPGADWPASQLAFLSEQFLSMVLTIPRQRVLGLGDAGRAEGAPADGLQTQAVQAAAWPEAAMRQDAAEAWVGQVVDLFLHGATAGHALTAAPVPRAAPRAARQSRQDPPGHG